MKTIEVKIDKSTLPNDGEKVSWLSLNDDTWYIGTYIDEDEVFVTATNKPHFAFSIIEWCKIEDTQEVTAYDCANCGWLGEYDDLVNDSNELGVAVCPNCASTEVYAEEMTMKEYLKNKENE